MIRLFLIFVAIRIFVFPYPAHGFSAAVPMPFPLPEGNWRPLIELVDPSLQDKLETALNKDRLRLSLIRKKKMAVGVVDLSDPLNPRFARVNGRTMMYAASLPKIAILLAAYVSFEDGTLEETTQIHDDLVAMIRKSSNTAATRTIERIGLEKIQAVLLDPRYELFDPEMGGGLWVGKLYAKGGKRCPDPISGLSHAATVTQVCRFYYLLAAGKIINPRRSREMLEILANPGLHHKFVAVLERCAPGAKLYRKSGTWKTWHSDSVMVSGTVWRRYILVSMVESLRGEEILRDLVPVVEAILLPKDVSTSGSSGPPAEAGR